jgi:hypothetical protein
MPRLEIKYANTKIYKLVCRDLTVPEICVGYTTDFTNRKCKHKHVCSNIKHKDHNLKVYRYIRENGGWLNWQMVEIEKFPCLDEIEACKRERYYIETLKSSLNCNIPGRTKQEYREDNIETILAQSKQYREENKEEIAIRDKKYREEHKEHIKTDKKRYYKDNKEEIAICKKKYYDENKENIRAYYKKYAEEHSEKEVCDCGGTYQITKKNRHLNTKMHLAYILNNADTVHL